jgi:hypothetical protein
MYTINVSSLTGNTITLEFVRKDLTIAEFKQAVCAGHGGFILPCVQRLIYNRKQLEDHKTLESYLSVHPSNEPILIHLVLRLAGGVGLFPPVLTSFPYEERLRDICVNGRRWENTPIPKVAENRHMAMQWFPEGIHNKPPASTQLYNKLLKEIRDTPRSVEEVGHDLLIQNGYEKKDGDDFYLKKYEKEPQWEFVVRPRATLAKLLLRKKIDESVYECAYECAYERTNEWTNNEWTNEWSLAPEM